MFNKVTMIGLIMFASTGIAFAESFPGSASSGMHGQPKQESKSLSGVPATQPEGNSLSAGISDTASHPAEVEASSTVEEIKG